MLVITARTHKHSGKNFPDGTSWNLGLVVQEEERREQEAIAVKS